MSVVRGSSRSRCTHCSAPLGVIAVWWRHDGWNDLWLHPTCADDLARGLLRDVVEVEQGVRILGPMQVAVSCGDGTAA